jgi:hypothetical protein
MLSIAHPFDNVQLFSAFALVRAALFEFLPRDAHEPHLETAFRLDRRPDRAKPRFFERANGDAVARRRVDEARLDAWILKHESQLPPREIPRPARANARAPLTPALKVRRAAAPLPGRPGFRAPVRGETLRCGDKVAPWPG